MPVLDRDEFYPDVYIDPANAKFERVDINEVPEVLTDFKLDQFEDGQMPCLVLSFQGNQSSWCNTEIDELMADEKRYQEDLWRPYVYRNISN